MRIEISARQIQVDDFIEVYGRDGRYRVVKGPHRDVFSECYYFVNVLISDGTKVSYKDTDRLTVVRP